MSDSSSDDLMSDGVLTEPEIVPCLFITGAAIEVTDGSARLIGWVDLPYLGGQVRERRIVMRVAMTDITAREVMAGMRRKLTRAGN